MSRSPVSLCTMFEDRCLLCGQHLADDRRAYCSDDCENNDMYSPSISSSSSALSSPQLGYAVGPDVPSLMPSALGSALRPSSTGYPYSVSSSSSASSASCPNLQDDEYQDRTWVYNTSDASQHDPSEDPPLKFQNPINPSLSYVRRPSGIKSNSAVPKLARASRSQIVPIGVPNHALVLLHDDDLSSDADLSSEHEAAIHLGQGDHSTTAKVKRTRNRASLPACFSLLKIASPSKPLPSSPISSSGNTIARLSPSTPKVVTKNPCSSLHVSPTVVPLPSLHDTPRGRRREVGQSSCSRRSEFSSQSHSRSRRRDVQRTELDHCATELRTKQVLERSTHLHDRGRPTVRRNSSPISRLISDMEDAMNPETRPGVEDRRSESRWTYSRPRGRARVEELDGIGSSPNAPGYGIGRSGLINRERGQPIRIPL